MRVCGSSHPATTGYELRFNPSYELRSFCPCLMPNVWESNNEVVRSFIDPKNKGCYGIGIRRDKEFTLALLRREEEKEQQQKQRGAAREHLGDGQYDLREKCRRRPE